MSSADQGLRDYMERWRAEQDQPFTLRCLYCKLPMSLHDHQGTSKWIEESFEGMQSDAGLEWEAILYERLPLAEADQQVVHEPGTENEWIEPVICSACYMAREVVQKRIHIAKVRQSQRKNVRDKRARLRQASTGH